MAKDKLELYLEKYFGFGEFRHSQRDIIESILKGEDTLAVMPTGGGKSLCYQLPAMLLDGVTFVVSPLIALMKDQVDALVEKGISARYINSSQSPKEQYEILRQLENGEIKLLYIAPERFKAPSFLSALSKVKIALFAIDEAHCISQWGHDFRPDYMRLGKALSLLGKPKVAAFTATATEEVRVDILKQLAMSEPSVYVSGFARENLSFNVNSVTSKNEKFERILSLIREYKTGIIYCSTVKGVETVSEMLESNKIKHISYHGKMTANERDSAQEEFISKKASIAVATNAFGMGIDRADIRFVCHYDLAGSIEAYYQEAGRAGRDGKESYCELLFMYADKRVQEFFIEGSNPSLDLIENTYKILREKSDSEGLCLLSIEELGKLLQKHIYKKAVNTMSLSAAISVLRRYGYVERLETEGSRIKATKIVDRTLHHLDLAIDKSALDDKKRKDMSKLKSVLSFAYSNTCRHNWILDYFGEKSNSKCGKCDKCTSGASDKSKMLSEEEMVVVQKALSCIARMSTKLGRMQWLPRFGKMAVVKCLMGSKDEKILNSRLNELSTYGILKESGRTFVLDLIDSMLDAQLVEVTDGDYPLLGLTDKGVSLMFGERNVLFNFPEQKKAKKEGKTKIYETDELPCDEILYNKLVSKRNQLQHLRKVPAYVIFPNQVLKNLAELQPKTAEEAMQIKGIGQQKAATILPSFLKIIEEYNKLS